MADEAARPAAAAGPLPLESIDEILLLMAWFRAHPTRSAARRRYAELGRPERSPQTGRRSVRPEDGSRGPMMVVSMSIALT